MAKLVQMEKVPLKGNSQIKEDLIQDFIFKDPSVLGLGDLTPIQRERIQPQGGRLDILLGDDKGSRYEVEVQLGATDPSHIIRTIEYWDTEKKRYPQYDHCAVIVAEEITGRFMNVISLFNGSIPLIALQVSAYKMGDEVALAFTKVIDRLDRGNDEDDTFLATDRAYWEDKSTPKMLRNVDSIFKSISEYAPGYELKYNKFYIGVAQDGLAKNFVLFRPCKNYLYITFKGEETNELTQSIENEGLEVSFAPRWKEYSISLKDYEDYKKHKEFLDKLVKLSMEYKGIE